MNTAEDSKTSKLNTLSINSDFEEIMKQSFEFWHKKYVDSPLNYPLVWKKALESNSEIVKKIEEVWQNNTKQIAAIQMQQFFEMWSYAIRKSNFEMAKKIMHNWEEFWKNTTDEEFRIYTKVLQMIEKYWKDIQSKNIE